MPSHILKPITDQAGNLLQQSTVRVYEAGTTTLVADPFFGDSALTQQLANPYNCLSGVIDIYFATHHDVRIGVTPPGQTQEIVFDYIDTMEPPPTTTGPGGVVYNQTILDGDGNPLPQRGTVKVATGLQASDDAVNEVTVLAAEPASPGLDPNADPVVIGAGATGGGDANGSVVIGAGAIESPSSGSSVVVGNDATTDAGSYSAVVIGYVASVAGAGGGAVAVGSGASVQAA